MTDRLAPLLDHLATFLLIGVVAAPLLLAAVQTIPARPNVQWMAASPFYGPVTGVPMEYHFDPPWGFSVFLSNTGTGASEDVQIVLGASLPRAPARPSNVDILDRSILDYELVTTDEGMIVDLGPMEPGETLQVILFRVSSGDVRDVLHGGEPIEMFQAPPRFDQRFRLPLWALLGGLFLLAGVVVQNLAMRSRGVRAGG